MASGDRSAIAAILADGFVSVDVHGRSTFSGAMIELVNRLQIDRSKRTVATTLAEIATSPGEAVVLQHYSMTSAPDAPRTMPKMLQTLSIDIWRDVDGAWLLARTQTRETEVIDAHRSRRIAKSQDARDDETVLEQLKSHGSDLSKPTDIVFYLYIPSHGDAVTAGSELRSHGFQTEVCAPLGELPGGDVEKRWSVVSHLTTIPTLTAIYRAGLTMATLADRYNGEYDGWEAAIQK